MKVYFSLTAPVDLMYISNWADLTLFTSSTSKVFAVVSKIRVSKGSLNSAEAGLGTFTSCLERIGCLEINLRFVDFIPFIPLGQ